MTVLGIDTSNYTTSLSLADENGFVHVRKILDVKMGECGLRQSDALFLHTVNLPELFNELFEKYLLERGSHAKIDAGRFLYALFSCGKEHRFCVREYRRCACYEFFSPGGSYYGGS